MGPPRPHEGFLGSGVESHQGANVSSDTESRHCQERTRFVKAPFSSWDRTRKLYGLGCMSVCEIWLVSGGVRCVCVGGAASSQAETQGGETGQCLQCK